MTSRTSPPGARIGARARTTRETTIEARLTLDGGGPPRIATGLGFLDHMIEAMAFHGGLGLELAARGDLHIDDHHTVEDCALVIGSALDEALGDRVGIRRFGYAYAPLDEALARVVVDVSGRPFAAVELGLRRERLGDVACENLVHFFQSLSATGGLTLHVDVLRGENDHHRAEAAFKACGLALRAAVAVGAVDATPSTKGVLDRAERRGAGNGGNEAARVDLGAVPAEVVS